MATASGSVGTLWPPPRVLSASQGCRGLVLQGPDVPRQSPVHQARRGTHKGGRNPGARRVVLEPDLGGGPRSCRFVTQGWFFCSPASVSSSVKRLQPLDPISGCYVGFPGSAPETRGTWRMWSTAPDRRQISGSQTQREQANKGGLVVSAGTRPLWGPVGDSAVRARVVPWELAGGCSRGRG